MFFGRKKRERPEDPGKEKYPEENGGRSCNERRGRKEPVSNTGAVILRKRGEKIQPLGEGRGITIILQF